MSDKASSDLDVFDGLAAKKSRPSGAAPALPSSRGPVPPPAPPSNTRQKTLLGLPAPTKPGSPPPAPPSKPPAPPLKSSMPPAPPPPPRTQPGGFPPPPPPPSMSAAPPQPPAPGVAAPPPVASAKHDDVTPLPSLKAPPTPPAPAKPAAAAQPPPTPAAAAKPAVDVDWDDEDEATQVFDKGVEDTARALLHSAPPPPPPAAGAPPPPPPAAGTPTSLPEAGLVGRQVSVPPPSMPRAPLPPPPKSHTLPPAPALEVPAPSITWPQQQRGGRGGLWLVIAAVVVVGAAAAAYALTPKKGSIVVSVSGPGGKAIDGVQVYVDGTQRCDASPCQVTDLPRGVHFVKVAAAGYTTTAPKAVKINAGEESAENVELARGSEGTGLKVSAEGTGLKLSVDGKDYGPLPQEIKDLSPGEHTIRIDGGERYESMEKKVTVEADKLLTLEPKLKVKKGLATIKAGGNADGAKVLLVSGSERRPVPSLPLRVDITSDKPYSIVATKKGFAEFKQDIVFEDGQAERTFVVDLGSEAASEKEKAPEPAATPTPTPALVGGGSKPTPPKEEPKPAAASGKGTLNINSIPVSNVILDGRPLGPTPKVGVSVSPGTHTVIFVHAEHGRKAKSVTVEAGKTAAAVVRFP